MYSLILPANQTKKNHKSRNFVQSDAFWSKNVPSWIYLDCRWKHWNPGHKMAFNSLVNSPQKKRQQKISNSSLLIPPPQLKMNAGSSLSLPLKRMNCVNSRWAAPHSISWGFISSAAGLSCWQILTINIATESLHKENKPTAERERILYTTFLQFLKKKKKKEL